MIKFILVQVSIGSNLGLALMLIHQNRQGKTRLSKWYAPYDDDEKVSRNITDLPCDAQHGTCPFAGSAAWRSSSFDCPSGPEIPVQLCRGEQLNLDVCPLD